MDRRHTTVSDNCTLFPAHPFHVDIMFNIRIYGVRNMYSWLLLTQETGTQSG